MCWKGFGQMSCYYQRLTTYVFFLGLIWLFGGNASGQVSSVASIDGGTCEGCQAPGEGMFTASTDANGARVASSSPCPSGTCRGGGGTGGRDPSFCGRPAPQYPVPYFTPRPTVPTRLTYPPLMPHNSLPNYRNVYSYQHAGGLSRTNVHWHPNYPVAAFQRIHHIFELPR